MDKECRNCTFPLEATFQYCPQCSQKTNLHRLSFHEILHEGIHYFTHADKGFLQLLKALWLRTGNVAREYIEGKRKKYFAPLNFFLLVATIYVVIVNIAPVSNEGPDILKNHPEINYITDPVKKQQVLHIYERQGKAVKFMNKYSNIVAMIAAPLICFLYWLFYRKGKYSYTEHLIACMYMIGFSNLVYACVFVQIYRLMSSAPGPSSPIPIGLFMAFQVTYNSIYYYNFIGKRSSLAMFKSAGVSLLSIAMWFALTGFLIRYYITNGF